MVLDQASALLLEQLDSLGVRPMQQLTPEDARAQLVRLRNPNPPKAPMARAETLQVPTSSGPLDVRLLVPSPEPTGLILYFHGGGWVVGTLVDYEPLARELAARTGSAVALVEYRLAPEARYPAAVNDAEDALQWLASHVEQLLGSVLPIVVAGDSAGGNLAAVVAQRSRDRGSPQIALQVLLYPVVDFDPNRPSYVSPDNQLVLSRDTMIWFWDHYLPDVSRRRDPSASPLRQPDLAGLPEAIVVTAEHDVLRDEGEAYAQALTDAGVAVTARRIDGQMHGLFSRFAVHEASDQALAWLAQTIAGSLAARRAEA